MAFDTAFSEEHDGQLVLDLDGFDGPIDLLLSLARDQKVDLSRISVLALAEQYLAYVEQVRRIRLELAADYLVMAAWLAYLKSRLLLPDPDEPDEPSGEELAEALAFQLRRLDAMRQAAESLFARPKLGEHRIARGDPEALQIIETRRYGIGLHDILLAYGTIRQRGEAQSWQPAGAALHTVEAAVARIGRMLGRIPGWSLLTQLVESGSADDGLERRSALAATFGATLELAKRGLIELRQDGSFAPIYLRPVTAPGEEDSHG